MAMILSAFFSKFGELLLDLAKNEVEMLFGVPGQIKKLQNNLRKIGEVLIDAERKRIDDEAVDDWLKELQDVMYDADDLLDLCLIEADKRSEGSSSNSLVGFPIPSLSGIRKLSVDHEIGTKIRELNKRLEDGWRWRSELNLELTFPDMQRVTSQKGRVLGSTAWSTSGLPEEVKGALYLSYQDLPSSLKQCFIYCSLFPIKYTLNMHYITQLWIAEGFVKAEGSSTIEEIVEDYCRELITRNLLQP